MLVLRQRAGIAAHGKSRAEYAKVQREHAEPVAEDVENAAGEHCRRGKAGRLSFRRKLETSWLSKNTGNTQETGFR